MLSLLKTCHKPRFFLGFLLILFHLGKYLFFVDEKTTSEELQDGNEGRNKVVIAQPRGIVIEEEEEHDRHDIGHVLHHLHLLIVPFRRHIHRVPRVENIGHSPQETEETQMISHQTGENGYIKVPRNNGVVGREVLRPKEGLSTQRNSRWEEHIQRNQEGHL